MIDRIRLALARTLRKWANSLDPTGGGGPIEPPR